MNVTVRYRSASVGLVLWMLASMSGAALASPHPSEQEVLPFVERAARVLGKSSFAGSWLARAPGRLEVWIGVATKLDPQVKSDLRRRVPDGIDLRLKQVEFSLVELRRFMRATQKLLSSMNVKSVVSVEIQVKRNQILLISIEELDDELEVELDSRLPRGALRIHVDNEASTNFLPEPGEAPSEGTPGNNLGIFGALTLVTGFLCAVVLAIWRRDRRGRARPKESLDAGP